MLIPEPALLEAAFHRSKGRDKNHGRVRIGVCIFLPNSSIQLGSIDLLDFEIPQSLRFGGRQRLAIHTLVGGRRIIERLGPDDDDIQFQGIFSGATAESRAKAFDDLRLSGEIVWLTWESFRRQVIVRSLTADYHNRWWIPFQIRCTVVDQRRIVSAQRVSLAAVLAADLGTALLYAAGSGISLTPLQTAMSSMNALTMGSLDQTVAAAQTNLVLRSITGQIDQQSSLLSSPFPSGVGARGSAGAYLTRAQLAGSLAAAVNVRSYVGRIGMNIGGLDV